MSYRIHLGTNALSKKPIHIPLEEFTKTHTIIPGRTGMGKSFLLENLARNIIESRHGLILIDGKGDLYDRLLKFSVQRRLEKNVVLVDPEEDEWSPGINYLEVFKGTSPEALAELVLEGLMKFFKEDTEYKPWLEEWGPASLLPLIKGGFTLLELFHFTSLKEEDFRQTLLKNIDEDFYSQKWQELKAFKPPEQARILNVVKTRASRFWESKPLKNIFGQTKTTIDWLKVMQEGGIVLCKLGRSGKLTEKTASFIGAAIVHQILLNAPQRPVPKRRPLFFMVDEFQKFVCNDFTDALDRLRGYGIYLILACQHLSQLAQETPRLHDSVMTNCGNKLVFSLSRKDSEEMAVELFTGWIHQERIKDEIWQTKLRPRETTREIIAYGAAQASGSFSGQSSGSGAGQGITSSTALSEDGDLIVSSQSHSHSNTSFSSQSQGTSEMRSTSQTVSPVPWYEYEEYQERTSRTYYTIEEVKERYLAWVSNQDHRHLQVKLGSKKPIPAVTAEIQEIRVRPSDVIKFIASVNQKTARPTAEVSKEIEARVKAYLREGDISEYPANFREAKDEVAGEKRVSKEPESFREPKKERISEGPKSFPERFEILGHFMEAWIEFENVSTLTTDLSRQAPSFPSFVKAEITKLRRIRNKVVHGKNDHREITPELVERVRKLTAKLKEINKGENGSVVG